MNFGQIDSRLRGNDKRRAGTTKGTIGNRILPAAVGQKIGSSGYVIFGNDFRRK